MMRCAPFSLLALGLAACASALPPSPAPPAITPACPEVTAPAPEAYRPKPAYSGTPVVLPSPKVHVPRPVTVGDAFTVRGAIHHLHSRVHADEVNGKRISIVGYIVKTNFSAVPKCAVHRTGRGNPANCVAPLPSFSIAEEEGDVAGAMQVMGWASNFAQIYTLIEAIDRAPPARAAGVELTDEFWGNKLPNPVPNVGAKVKVTGTYAITFTKATSGLASDPQHGIMTAERIEFLTPPPQKAYLPGMKPKK